MIVCDDDDNIEDGDSDDYDHGDIHHLFLTIFNFFSVSQNLFCSKVDRFS